MLKVTEGSVNVGKPDLVKVRPVTLIHKGDRTPFGRQKISMKLDTF